MKTKPFLPLLLAALVMASCAKEDLSSDNAATLDKIYLGGPGINNFSGDFTGDNFNDFEENPFVKVIEQPVSTFSVDADGASYSYIRRQLLDMDAFPPKAAVRTEELINYFPLNYAPPVGNHPVSVNGEVAECPWAEGHKLVRIGIQGKTLGELPPSNIVLLIDVSGSMSNEDKLPLLKDAFEILVDQFDKQDRIAIVTYAGEAGVALNSTSGDKKSIIKQAIQGLGSGGSTAGAQGLITAYEIAMLNFIEGGNNRIILGTDGDFNVGVSSQEALIDLIEEKGNWASSSPCSGSARAISTMECSSRWQTTATVPMSISTTWNRQKKSSYMSLANFTPWPKT
ncbi:MAG: von Willebrand factor type A domain-containing protein [Saprospirales bacterium]|nr:von Willebrand factor type A domain-containing protein [Saprospirales bacterium]